MTQQQTPKPTLPDPYRKPERRSNAPLGIAVAVAACICVALAVLAWPKASSEPPPITSQTVVYEVDSTGTSEGSITLQAPTGTQQAKAALPLKTTAGETGLMYPGFQSGAFVYLSVQNTNAAGSVTCRIRIGDTVVSENTSVGGYTIATCKGLVP